MICHSPRAIGTLKAAFCKTTTGDRMLCEIFGLDGNIYTDSAIKGDLGTITITLSNESKYSIYKLI